MGFFTFIFFVLVIGALVLDSMIFHALIKKSDNPKEIIDSVDGVKVFRGLYLAYRLITAD